MERWRPRAKQPDLWLGGEHVPQRTGRRGGKVGDGSEERVDVEDRGLQGRGFCCAVQKEWELEHYRGVCIMQTLPCGTAKSQGQTQEEIVYFCYKSVCLHSHFVCVWMHASKCTRGLSLCLCRCVCVYVCLRARVCRYDCMYQPVCVLCVVLHRFPCPSDCPDRLLVKPGGATSGVPPRCLAVVACKRPGHRWKSSGNDDL